MLSGTEFEKGFLGYCLRFPDNITLSIDEIATEDFSSTKLKAIFNSLKSLHEKKAPIDPLSLSNELKVQGWEIPASEIIELEDFSFDGIDVIYYKDQIKTSSQRRKLHNFLTEAIKDAENPLIEFADLEERIGQGIIQILNRSKPFESNLLKPTESFFPEIKELFNGRSINGGVRTGWEEFDRLMGGLRPNELTEITGETGSGKTTFSVNLGYKLAKKAYPILIASFEMRPLAVVKKMLQTESGRPISSHSLDSISPFFLSLSSLPIFFVDTYGEMALPQLKRLIYYSKRVCGVQFVILDHLHFFLKYQADQERQAIDQALRDIKSWAMELGIHIILIVHPTKLTYDNKVVHLNDLKGSSGLKQIPDNVLSIWRPRGEDDLKNPQNEIVLYILKVRDDDGDEGKLILTFDKRSQSYSDSRPGFARPVEGKASPELPSPSPRSFSGKELASGYDR